MNIEINLDASNEYLYMYLLEILDQCKISMGFVTKIIISFCKIKIRFYYESSDRQMYLRINGVEANKVGDLLHF